MFSVDFEPQDFRAPKRFYPNFVNLVSAAYKQSLRTHAPVRIRFNGSSMVLDASDFRRCKDGDEQALQSAKEIQNLADIRAELGLRTPEYMLAPERAYESMAMFGRSQLRSAIERASKIRKVVTLEFGSSVLAVCHNDHAEELERAFSRCLTMASLRNAGWQSLSRAIRPPHDPALEPLKIAVNSYGQAYRYN